MPFDPTFPPHGVGLESAPWRDQFNALNDRLVEQEVITAGHLQRIDDLEQALQALQAQAPNWMTQADVEPITANNIDSVTELPLTLSDPPVTDELQQVLDKLNQTVVALHR